MISLLNANIPVPQTDSQELSELPASDIQEIYYGTDGLRSAVLRLLSVLCGNSGSSLVSILQEVENYS